MLGKEEPMLEGEETASPVSSTLESAPPGSMDEKLPRKRKRKGLGNWTRTTLACNRCRKMKIRVPVPQVRGSP